MAREISDSPIGLTYALGDTEALKKRDTERLEKSLKSKTDIIELNTKKKEAYNELNSLVDAFKKTSEEFSEIGLNVFLQKKPSSISTSESGDGADYVSITSQSTSSVGSFSVKVNQIATSSKLIIQDSTNAAFADAPNLVGTLNLTTTVAGAATNFQIVLDGSESLNNVLTSINNKFVALGLDFEAVKLKDLATGKHFIQISSKNTGSSSIAMTWTDAGTNDMMKQKSNTSGVNAQAEINGVAQEYSSNRLSGVLTGIDITLKKVNTGINSQTVTIDYDGSAMVGALERFMDSYNKLSSFVKSQTNPGVIAKNPQNMFRVDNSGQSPLFGTREITAAQSMLDRITGIAPGLSGNIKSFGDIGIELQRVIASDNTDGAYHLYLKDNNRLEQALLYNFEGLKNLFINNVSITNDVGNHNSALNFISCKTQLASSVVGTDLTCEVTVDIAKIITGVNIKDAGGNIIATGTHVYKGSFEYISFEGTVLEGLKFFFSPGDASNQTEEFTFNISHGLASLASLDANVLSDDNKTSGLVQIAISNLDTKSLKLEEEKAQAQKRLNSKLSEMDRIFAQISTLELMADQEIKTIQAMFYDGS